jgi:phosphatidylserine decarboxylase
MPNPLPHQYIDRATGCVRDERLFSDALVRRLYSTVRETAPAFFRLATSRHTTALLGLLNYDLPFGAALSGQRAFLRECGVKLAECVKSPAALHTVRQIFERQIRYWECRPLPPERQAVVAPADARLLVGSLRQQSSLFLKGKFFELEELLGRDKVPWLRAFAHGDWAIFRLTPDKYHYNHTPVAGRILDFYEVRGRYHACNPAAVIAEVTPYSKNTRTVTILDTDVAGGTGVGLVAMLEITALLIGQVQQRYSTLEYDNPRPLVPGMRVERGCPKSLYRPGSSTDVLLFQPGRLQFDADLLANQRRTNVQSRFSQAFGQPLVETDVTVRSQIGLAQATALVLNARPGEGRSSSTVLARSE